ncbi:MAG: YggU family protein [Gemmatimonadales bacterium]|nr:YggU family protein [Gemmatimonadales bacterium]
MGYSTLHPTVLPVHVQPRASRTEVVGWHGDAVKIRLAAPPVDGAANAALVAFLAERLGLPRGSVTVVAGVKGRRKRVGIAGRSLDEVLAALGLR